MLGTSYEDLKVIDCGEQVNGEMAVWPLDL